MPGNLVVGAALLALARGSGLSWEEVGLNRRHLRRGLATGAAAASVAGTLMLVGALWGPTRALFDDQRVPADASTSQRLYQLAVRIPVGTVAFEEVAFRGVLFGLLTRRLSLGSAVIIDSALFGLWHILPTLGTARANDIVGLQRVGLVAGSVVVTFAGGILFCALRVRSGHLAAPAVLHLAFNDSGYVLAWWARG